MDRGFIKTKSITQIVENNDSTVLRYEDLQTKKISTAEFIFP
jgi:hypothetical protein